MKLHTQSCAFVLAGLLSAASLPLAAQTNAAAVATTDPSTAYSLLHHPRALARFLHLSATETTETVALYNTLQQTVQPLRDARPPLCTQLITDLSANPQQSSVVGSDSINLYENKQQIVAAREAFNTSFSALLDPAQLTAYDALKTLAQFADPEVNVIGDCPRPTS
jgi:hypothetical protein